MLEEELQALIPRREWTRALANVPALLEPEGQDS